MDTTVTTAHFTGAHAAEEPQVAPARASAFWRPTAKTGLVSWLTTVDHKRIGTLYAIFALFFFLVGGVEALLIRLPPTTTC